jgi:hypothetical protein
MSKVIVRSSLMALGGVLAGLLVMGAELTQAAGKQTNEQAERFTAFAVNLGTPGRTGAGTVEIKVDRWSTDEELEKLLTVLREQGPEKLLSTLQKLPRVGFIRTPNSIGYDLHYARKSGLPEQGRTIVIGTDRPIGFWEASNRPRSIDYPFTLIEMHIRPDGEGEGKMSLATKITTEDNGKTIVLENYSSQPVMLTSVKRAKKT